MRLAQDSGIYDHLGRCTPKLLSKPADGTLLRCPGTQATWGTGRGPPTQSQAAFVTIDTLV